MKFTGTEPAARGMKLWLEHQGRFREDLVSFPESHSMEKLVISRQVILARLAGAAARSRRGAPPEGRGELSGEHDFRSIRWATEHAGQGEGSAVEFLRLQIGRSFNQPSSAQHYGLWAIMQLADWFQSLQD